MPSRQILLLHLLLDELTRHVASNLMINFTPKQPWLNIPGSMSIHFRS